MSPHAAARMPDASLSDLVGLWTAGRPKKMSKQSVPGRNCHGGNSVKMLLLSMVCVRHTAVIQPREFVEMVEEGIREAAALAVVRCEVVRPLPLGSDVAA